MDDLACEALVIIIVGRIQRQASSELYKFDELDKREKVLEHKISFKATLEFRFNFENTIITVKIKED